MLLRTWNLYHGNTVPPGRVNLLKEAVRLAASGEPAVVCLQELPAWALEYLDEWSGMISLGEVAARTLVPRELGRRLTALNPGFFRSAFTGQANAILVAPELRAGDHRMLVLNPRTIRARAAAELRLGFRTRLAWAWERRMCHAVRVTLPDGRPLVVVNLHATSYRDRRLADVEVLRAAAFADELAEPSTAIVLGGDFNLTASSHALEALGSEEWGFSTAGPGIDHVLVRGAPATPVEVWPLERRRLDGRILSDHAPVEVRIS